MTLNFHLRVHLTSKSKMAAFDLYRQFKLLAAISRYLDEILDSGDFEVTYTISCKNVSYKSIFDLNIQDGVL